MTISRNSGKGRGSWTACVRISLVDEQGTKRPIPHDADFVTVTPASGVKISPIVEKKDDSIRGFTFTMPDGTESITLDLVGRIDDSQVGRRSMADALVTYPSPLGGKL
jgi:hypothetical protein